MSATRGFSCWINQNVMNVHTRHIQLFLSTEKGGVEVIKLWGEGGARCLCQHSLCVFSLPPTRSKSVSISSKDSLTNALNFSRPVDIIAIFANICPFGILEKKKEKGVINKSLYTSFFFVFSSSSQFQQLMLFSLSRCSLELEKTSIGIERR